MKLKDLTGQRFGRLTVVARSENKKYPCGSSLVSYLCQCDCGAEKVVLATNLRNSHVSSCGCLQNEARIGTHTKHGARNHRLYTIWTNIKQRCNNPNNDDFKNYGARGITVCAEWLNDFKAFYDWAMSSGYADNLSIDRKDNDKGYSPENCRWATMKEQRHNRRDSRREWEAGFDLKVSDTE